jgi:hypothetical protein
MDYAYPDEISTEIRISCRLIDLSSTILEDTASVPNVWVTSSLTNGFAAREFDAFGQCWCYNTDSLPTIDSSKAEIAWRDIKDYYGRYPYLLTSQGVELYSFTPVRTGIPVSSSDKKLIVRGYVRFNTSLVKYSDPLVLDNPIQYVN